MPRRFGWLVVLLCCGAPTAWAESRTPIQPGTPAPAWKSLPGVDGKLHSLDDLKDSKLVVVAFTCNSCPFAEAYEDRFIDFAKQYQPKQVAFIAVNVNLEDEDKLPMMKQRATEKAFPFPYLYDESQKLGLEYGAKATPHLFVLDEDRKVAYVGAFDNNSKVSKANKHYVKDAVEALLAGSRPAVSSTKSIGCSIRYDE